MNEDGGRKAPVFVSDQELDYLKGELQDERHWKRGPDGFDRPLYVSPAKWDQIRALVNELIARRKVGRNGR